MSNDVVLIKIDLMLSRAHASGWGWGGSTLTCILANTCILALPLEIPFSTSDLWLLLLRLGSGTRTVSVHCSNEE
jgi:hypothetical protein